MHELGVLLEVVKEVSFIAQENQVDRIDKLVLQVGELCSMIPKYMQKIYPMAVVDTVLQDSVLEIEIIPGNGLCKNCGAVFNLIKNKGICCSCHSKDFELLSGKEFIIKEIACYDEDLSEE